MSASSGPAAWQCILQAVIGRKRNPREAPNVASDYRTRAAKFPADGTHNFIGWRVWSFAMFSHTHALQFRRQCGFAVALWEAMHLKSDLSGWKVWKVWKCEFSCQVHLQFSTKNKLTNYLICKSMNWKLSLVLTVIFSLVATISGAPCWSNS